MEKVLVICGPTATGKTGLAAAIAGKFSGELISADSRQVYRGMDLTTGKERPGVPVWLYDVADPDGEFSVSHWVKLATHAIEDIRKRKKLPIVVGGTGLYIRALLEPLETIAIPPDAKLRKDLSPLSVRDLQKLVPRGDMNESDWNNPRRLIRRIEIARSGKHPARRAVPYDSLTIGLTAPLAVLDKRIDTRLLVRRKQGLDKEISGLRDRYDRHLPSMSAVDINEHAYARRQLTWFKKIPGILWFDVSDPAYVRQVTEEVSRWYTKGGI